MKLKRFIATLAMVVVVIMSTTSFGQTVDMTGEVSWNIVGQLSDVATWRFYFSQESGVYGAPTLEIPYVAGLTEYTTTVHPIVVPDGAVTRVYVTMSAVDSLGRETARSNEAFADADTRGKPYILRFTFGVN